MSIEVKEHKTYSVEVSDEAGHNYIDFSINERDKVEVTGYAFKLGFCNSLEDLQDRVTLFSSMIQKCRDIADEQST